MLAGWVTDEDKVRCYPSSSTTWSKQCAAGAVVVAMSILAEQHQDCIQQLQLLENPTSCRTLKAYNKGCLTLVCLSTKVATVEPKGNKVHMQVHHKEKTIDLWLQPSTVNPLDACKQPAENAFVAPFWFVSECTDETTSANLTLSTCKVDVGPYTCCMPVLVNDKRVAKDETLTYKSEPMTKKHKAT